MGDTIVMVVGYVRDLGLPADVIARAQSGQVELWNTARRFPCHERYTGEFVRGIFYGVIDPSLPDADDVRARARDLDAHKFEWVTVENVRDWARAYYPKLLPNRFGAGFNPDEFKEIDLVRSYIRHREKED